MADCIIVSHHHHHLQRGRASAFAQARVLGKKVMRKPSPRDERAMGQMHGETGRQLLATGKLMRSGKESLGLIWGKGITFYFNCLSIRKLKGI